jgi:DNA helicase-2/ATP-dependent DNA helicase PcrA
MIDGITSNSDHDDHVDEEIAGCLKIVAPRSFFLFAGAGSGKTRSLIKALGLLLQDHGSHLRLHGQKIGVITYTNAACDEIVGRIKSDSLIEVRTIHSFAWLLIGGFNNDIREWLRYKLSEELTGLQGEESRGRPGTKASLNRQAQIERKQRRLKDLDAVRKFVYSPTGDNREWDALSHYEVIRLCAHFLGNKPTMQRILVNQYPFLLIDESQDTNHELVDALLEVQIAHRDRFCLGFLGDTMQRIYNDGKVGIEDALPRDWAKPEKKLNHRCPKRVITLINRIRSIVDGHEQVARTDKRDGWFRFFLFPNDLPDKLAAEKEVRSRMADITGDVDWTDASKCKTLILEHHMAARRMEFLEMFKPLYGVDDYQHGLLDGSLPAVRFFAQQVLPLIKAEERGDKFAVAGIMRKFSPLLSAETLKCAADQPGQIAMAKMAVCELMRLFNGHSPSFGSVLRKINELNMFTVPESLTPFRMEPGTEIHEPFDDRLSYRQKALEEFLESPFSQIESYSSYVEGNAPFDTHQGVKGREFPRVMVIMDDSEARGFLFSYEKLFGTKGDSAADLSRKSAGDDTVIDRTRRLFYVTCSRVQESLALVVYSAKPMAVRSHLLGSDWCDEEEIIMDLSIG